MHDNLEKLKRIALRRALIKSKGLTYQDFGVDRSIVWRVIHEAQPNRKVRVRIARRLKVPVAQLFPPEENIVSISAKRNMRAGRQGSSVKKAA